MLDSAGAGRHPIVLIASHQESSSRSLESILGPNGYTVVKAYTAAQTLERTRRAQPDAIILDATLPDQDPLEICRTLRHDPEFAPDTPIIIVSSDHATRQQRLDALRAGAWEYLGQPLDAEHLLLKLETFTRVKRGADRAREEGLVDQATGLYNLRGLARRARELGAQASRLTPRSPAWPWHQISEMASPGRSRPTGCWRRSWPSWRPRSGRRAASRTPSAGWDRPNSPSSRPGPMQGGRYVWRSASPTQSRRPRAKT